MPTFKRMISAVEGAQQIMNKWSDDESNAVDMVILPPDNFDTRQMKKRYKVMV